MFILNIVNSSLWTVMMFNCYVVMFSFLSIGWLIRKKKLCVKYFYIFKKQYIYYKVLSNSSIPK